MSVAEDFFFLLRHFLRRILIECERRPFSFNGKQYKVINNISSIIGGKFLIVTKLLHTAKDVKTFLESCSVFLLFKGC
jgi:sensor histidine kinase YesM